MKARDEAEASRLETERWLRKRFPDEFRLALQSIGEAARDIKGWVIIPTKATTSDPKYILLVDLVIGDLRKMGFGVYCRESGEDLKIKEYCVTWGNGSVMIPEGFKLIE